MSSRSPQRIPSHPMQTFFISSYIASEKYGQSKVFIPLFIISRPTKSPNNSKLRLIVAVCQITPISFFPDSLVVDDISASWKANPFAFDLISSKYSMNENSSSSLLTDDPVTSSQSDWAST